jgi:uncharacterized protein (TIGR02246 family)
MHRIVTSLAALLVLAVSGCAPQVDVEADRAAIRTMIDDFVAAENAGDIEAIMARTTDDAVMMPPNAPAITGKNAVRAWREDFLSQFTIEAAVPEPEIQAFGDWGFVRGTWAATLTPKEGGEPQEVSYSVIAVVHREADGSWKEARVIWNSDQPAATATD